MEKLTYETLPEELRNKLFLAHDHAGLLGESEVVYMESDVIDIINYCMNIKS